MNKLRIISLTVITIVILSGVGVGLYFIFREDPYTARKPAIYLYNVNDETFTDSLSVTIPNGYATITIPQTSLGSTISWNNLEVHPKGQIIYKETSYPYLFYEAEINSKPDLSERGWCIEVDNDVYIFNGQNYNLQDFKDTLSTYILKLGLYKTETVDFIDYWFEVEPLFTKDGFHYLIQLESYWIEDNFQINTNLEYSTNRIFFGYSFSDVPHLNNLKVPTENWVDVNSNYILHEWGIII